MTAPRRRTIHDAAAPFENYLINVPAPAADVCTTCHSSLFDASWSRCFPCNDTARRLPATADVVASVSLAPSSEQLARDLYAYKDVRIDAARRQRLVWGLGAVTYKWLHLHESCLARAAGATGFDVITSVPSSSGRAGEHPIVTALTAVVTGSGARYRDLLVAARTDLGPREVAADRYSTTQPVLGDILLIDDSWVSGAKPQAAAAALKEAGAASVAILTVGRWFQPDYPPNVAWLRDKRRPGWDWMTCCMH